MCQVVQQLLCEFSLCSFEYFRIILPVCTLYELNNQTLATVINPVGSLRRRAVQAQVSISMSNKERQQRQPLDVDHRVFCLHLPTSYTLAALHYAHRTVEIADRWSATRL